MSEHKMTEVQIRLLEMMKWFDDFCKENKLTYYAIGGTMLGAYRHQGFIPWDDDIDVGMPRADYEKLEQIFQDRREEFYVLETPNSPHKEFCYPFTKLYNTRTTLVENYREPIVRGIYMDIFPLDGAGRDERLGKKWCKKIYHKYQFYLARTSGIRKGRSMIKNLAVKMVRILPDFIFDDVKLRMQINAMCGKHEYATSALVGNIVGDAGERELMSRKIFGKPTEYIFEDMKIMGVEKPDEYLTQIYGDWRKLPPEEKRISHHDYLYMNLELSYQDYKKGGHV